MYTQLIYSFPKIQIIGITKSYASLLESTNILVNSIVPDIHGNVHDTTQKKFTIMVYYLNSALSDSMAPMDGGSHLEWLSYDHCIRAYLAIIENTCISGKINTHEH